jgi:hypothetical protein
MSDKKLFSVSFCLFIQDYPDIRKNQNVTLIVRAKNDLHARISVVKHYKEMSSIDCSYSVTFIDVAECLDMDITPEDEIEYKYL